MSYLKFASILCAVLVLLALDSNAQYVRLSKGAIMPYEGVAVGLETYRLDIKIDDDQQKLILRQEEELDAARAAKGILESAYNIQTNRVHFLQVQNETTQKTLEDVRGEMATLYKITQKPRFRIPLWIPGTLGVVLGAYGTYRIMK